MTTTNCVCLRCSSASTTEVEFNSTLIVFRLEYKIHFMLSLPPSAFVSSFCLSSFLSWDIYRLEGKESCDTDHIVLWVGFTPYFLDL